ncbi:MAG: ABC transporter substrate-binding protein [Geminicoccaceae bacterium]
MRLSRRHFAAATLAILAVPGRLRAASFADVRGAARGQTVYFNAWGGSEPINAYVAWVGQRVAELYGITLQHVKLTDTGDAVARVLAEKAAGRVSGGTVDLVWINGENFRAMKRQGLLHGPFTAELPNFALVDTRNKPTTLIDFTEPTDGLESPWGMAQFILIHDSARVPQPPRSIAGLFDWAAANPGRLTWPAPPDFIGSTFLKHVLHETLADPAPLREPVDAATFTAVSQPVWDALDRVLPNLWRKGQVWPASGPALHQLMEDGEVDFSMAFNPAEASGLVAQGRLPETTRSFILERGTIANTHFVAIPFNASAREGAMVVADFLLSPEAQARKQDPGGWGDFTVLDVPALPPADRALFEALPRGVATLAPEELLPVLQEPDASWMTQIEDGWRRRYAS